MFRLRVFKVEDELESVSQLYFLDVFYAQFHESAFKNGTRLI